jgi:methyl-accepting chemotaxis protein
MINLTYSTQLAIRVAIIVSLTGFVTASCAYLLTERLLRSGAARALKYGTPGRLAVPGVTTRALLAWALGTALPVGGLIAVGILALAGDRSITVHKLGVAVVVLCATGILVGCLAVTLAARATADPINAVRRALAQVQRGDFTVRIPERTSAPEVVAAINRLFERIVPIIHAHGGRVDKFSVIGDTVNVAARVEAATRQTGDTVLISDRTRALLVAEHPTLVEREGVVLKGKQDAVRVYAVAGVPGSD